MQGYPLINDILFILFIAAISASFSYMLDFALGYPGKEDASEVNTKSFLFGWSFFLAKRRLSIGQLFEIKDKYNQLDDSTKYEIEMLNRQYKTHVFGIARELFTWEFAFGMCIYCTGFWIALIFSILIYLMPVQHLIILPKYFVLITTPVFSHLILRKYERFFKHL